TRSTQGCPGTGQKPPVLLPPHDHALRMRQFRAGRATTTRRRLQRAPRTGHTVWPRTSSGPRHSAQHRACPATDDPAHVLPRPAVASRLRSLDATTTDPPEFDTRWLKVFPDQAALRAHVDRWPIGEAVPDDMTAVLRVARKLLVDSYADYEVAL